MAIAGLVYAGALSGISCPPTSPGISTTTGAGRPVRKAWKARRITIPVWSGLVITSTLLTTAGQVFAATKFGRTNSMFNGLPPGRARIAELSALACASPPTEFSAPA